MAKPIRVIFKREQRGESMLRVAQEWGMDVAGVGALCISYMILGEVPVLYPSIALLGVLFFYGTGGIQDTLFFSEGQRRVTRRVRCCGIPIKTDIFQGSAPAFMLMGAFGEVGGRRVFRWTYRPVLILQDGTAIQFSRPREDAPRVQQAVLKAAHHLGLPVRTVPQNEEFLPPRSGFVDMKTPLLTRTEQESEAFHQEVYTGRMKGLMLIAMTGGFLLAIFFTTQL